MHTVIVFNSALTQLSSYAITHPFHPYRRSKLLKMRLINGMPSTSTAALYSLLIDQFQTRAHLDVTALLTMCMYCPKHPSSYVL